MLKRNLKKDKILIIIPAYNEEESILSTYQSVMDYNKKDKPISLDVMVINDGSKDNTKRLSLIHILIPKKFVLF